MYTMSDIQQIQISILMVEKKNENKWQQRIKDLMIISQETFYFHIHESLNFTKSDSKVFLIKYISWITGTGMEQAVSFNIVPENWSVRITVWTGHVY